MYGNITWWNHYGKQYVIYNSQKKKNKKKTPETI